MGVPRSGTTLFDLVMGSHPDGFSLGELNLFGRADRTIDRAGRLCGICEGPCPFWEKRVPAHFGGRWYGSGLVGRFRRRFGPGLYQTLFAASGSRFLVDSSKPPSWMKARLADARDWRDAEPRLILIERDGRAVVNSFARKNPDRPITDHIDRWRRLVDRLEAAYDGFAPEHRLRVSYEELCTMPEETASRLAAAAGVAYHAGMLAYWRHDHHLIGGNAGTRSLILRHQQADEEGDIPFEPSNASKAAYYRERGLAISLDERWRQELSQDHQETFERLAGERNEPYRYDGAVDTPGSG